MIWSEFAKRQGKYWCLKYIKIQSKICLSDSCKKDNSWSVMSSATSQLHGASWELGVKYYPWAKVKGEHILLLNSTMPENVTQIKS